MIIARNPAQYGFTLSRADAGRPAETVTVSGPVDLRRVAEWTGTPVDVIQQLNPELRRWTTPVRGQALRAEGAVGHGRGAAGAARRDRRRPNAARCNWHTVRPGETLATIARKLRVNRADLAEANYLSVQLARPRRPEAGHPARAGGADGVAARPADAGGRRPPDVERATLVTEAPRVRVVVEPRATGLPREARRHAVVDRAALRDQRHGDQAVEPAARRTASAPASA